MASLPTYCVARRLLCLLLVITAITGAPLAATAAAPAEAEGRKKVALLVADWAPNTHPEVLFGCILQTYTRDGKGLASQLEVASVYRDLPTDRDLTATYAAEHGFPIVASVEEALTLGTGALAVDGVLISTEWAPYPESDTGQIIYPHRQMFEACVKVFKESGRVVPVFIDKHLADTHQDSQWIYDTAREMNIPLMAGSSVPLCLLEAEAVVDDKSELKEIVGVSYHTLTTYGFHGLEMTQALAECRKGGETGIKQVRCLTGADVWSAAGREYDPELLAAALEKSGATPPEGKTPADLVPEPILFVIDYADGLRANLFTLNGLAMGWSAAWRYADGRRAATLFANERHLERIRFDWQMKGIEDMILTGKPAWPVERTLLSSGTLDAALISKRDGGNLLPTPFLMISYPPGLAWQPPEELKAKLEPK